MYGGIAPSGFAGPHLAARSRGQKHAGQGSNLPSGGFVFRFPIWRRVFRHWNFRRIVLAISMRREGFEPPCISEERAGLRPAALPFCHLRVMQVSVEGFEPSTPCARGTCAAKLRYTLKRTSMLPVGIEPIIFRLKAGHPDRWTTGAERSAMLSAGIEPASSP